MHNRSMSSLFAATLAVTLYIASTASANSYICLYTTPCEVYARANAVFIGRVIDGTKRLVFKKNDDGKIYVTGDVRFAVEEAFLGITSTVVEITPQAPEGNMSFVQGEPYLVYAYEIKGKLHTSHCFRTKLVSESKEDIEFLRNLPEPGLGGRLYGKTGRYASPESDMEALQGVTVTAINEQQESFTTTSDSKGYYEFSRLKQGKYRIIPDWPEHYINSDFETEKEFTVVDGGCINVLLSAQIDSSLKGKVFDSEGIPAPAYMKLISVNNEKMYSSVRTKEEGAFNIRSLPPGRYFLILYLSSPKRTAPIYYPGVTDKSKAQVIELGFGQKLDGFNFILPQNQRVRTVKGIVTYPDGLPVKEASVALNLRSMKGDIEIVSLAKTDSEGNFTLSGFEGGVYTIDAVKFIYTNDDPKSTREKRWYSNRTELKLDKDIEGIKLVMKTSEKAEKPSGNSQ